MVIFIRHRVSYVPPVRVCMAHEMGQSACWWCCCCWLRTRTSSSNTFINWRPKPRLSEELRLGEATILATKLEASMRTHGIRPRGGDKELPPPLTTTSDCALRDSSIVIIFLDQMCLP